jgi:hypothetical protein
MGKDMRRYVQLTQQLPTSVTTVGWKPAWNPGLMSHKLSIFTAMKTTHHRDTEETTRIRIFSVPPYLRASVVKGFYSAAANFGDDSWLETRTESRLNIAQVIDFRVNTNCPFHGMPR